MEQDLVLGEGDEVEEIEEEIGYTYPEYISSAVEVLTMLESANPMTKSEVRRVEELKKLCFEMLEFSVKSMYQTLFNSDIDC
jgi:hypothetical protein